jgi:hypothetical protein
MTCLKGLAGSLGLFQLRKLNPWFKTLQLQNNAFDVVLTVHRRYYVEIKCQLDATDEFLLRILVLAQHVSGTIVPIIRSSRVL